MAFECIWGWGVGHLHKGWFIWFMDCDGSAATDGFLVFMSEYLVCAYICILRYWCPDANEGGSLLLGAEGQREDGRCIGRSKLTQGRLISATSQGCLVAKNIVHLNHRLPLSFIWGCLSFLPGKECISWLPKKSSLRPGLVLSLLRVWFKPLNFVGSNETQTGNAY